jgi:hypothetical protein
MIIKKWIVGFVLFLAALTASAQGHVPTLGSNNAWTGDNSFILGHLALNSGASCPGSEVVAGYNADFSLNCVNAGGGGAGVSSLNTRTGAIILAPTSSVTITEGPTGTFTFAAPNSGVTTINGTNGPITLANGTNISIVQSPSGTFTINCSGCTGGGGSGVVDNGTARQFVIYTANGTTASPHPNYYSLDSNMSLSDIQTLINSLNCGACNGTYNTIVIPDGVPFQPWTNYTQGFPAANPGTGMDDQRTGTKFVQMTRYGLVPDALLGIVDFTASSTTVTAVGGFVFSCPSGFPCTSGGSVGQTISAGWFVGNYYTGTQYRFVPTIVSVQSQSAATLSTPAPATGTNVSVWKGTDNCTAFNTYAMVGLGGALTGGLSTQGLVGLLPAGYMLTTCPVSWNASQSWMGQNMSDSFIVGTPATDVIDAGNVGGTGLYWGKMTLIPDGSISASQHPYTDVEANGATSTVPPFYRPLHVGQPDSNNPLAQGWCASCDNNYVANTTQNHGVVCVPTGLARVPQIGDEVVFPYTPTVFKSAVTANTGTTCGGGFVDVTISPVIPNVSGYTLTQTPFYASLAANGIQHLSVAISAGALSYPFNITVANPIQPYPGSVSNVATHGHIKIGNEEYDYMGVSYTSPYTYTLRAGPSTTAGWSTMTPVVPLNPCYAKFDVPYPVVPTVNSGQATPVNAVFFPGLCGGNFGLAEPDLDGLTDTGGSFFRAHLEDVNIQSFTLNPGKGLGGWYLAGNHAPYASTFFDFRMYGGDFGFAQGPASQNEFNIGSVGPTGDGNSFTNWSVTAAYIISMTGQQNSNIDRWDAYSTSYNPFDGSPNGANAAIYIGYTQNEQTGGGVQGTAYDYITNWNAEPENGSHIDNPPYFYSGCNLCVYNANTFEGAGVILEGSNTQITNEQLGASVGNPLIVYGNENTIADTIDTATGKVSNLWGVGSVLNWGSNNNITVPAAYGSGQSIAPAPGLREKTSGYDSGSFRDGLAATPYVSDKEGYYSNYEFGPTVLNGVDPSPTQIGPVVDPTAPESGSYVGCYIGTSYGCSPFHIGGFFGYSYVGPDNRIAAIPYVVTAAFKTTSNQTFQFLVNTLTDGSAGSTCSGFHQPLSVSVTTVGGQWTTVRYPADFTGSTGCIVQFVWQFSTSADVLQIAYMDFQPVPKSTTMATVSSSIEGTACTVPALLGTDGSYVYFCTGTIVKRAPIT